MKNNRGLFLQLINQKKSMKWIVGLLGICRPFWAFFLTYCYFIFLFEIIDQKTIIPISLGFFSMVFFYLGHFSLNNFFDRSYDHENPRKDILNSWEKDSEVRARWIWVTIGIVWIIGFYFAVLHRIWYEKNLPILIILAMLFSILYSVPPCYLKGRAPWDLILNVLSFGIIGPLFTMESIPFYLAIDVYNLILILLFSSSTLVIVILPTIMMDSEIDRKFNLKTFSVRYGIKASKNVIILSLIVQIASLIGIGWEFFISGNYVGFIAIIIFLYGEMIIVSPLFDLHIPDEKAEFIATNLVLSFIGGSLLLLGFIILSKILGLNINLVIQNALNSFFSK